MDLFTTCREGQRLGLFAGSGIGKTSLVAMLARNADCDLIVIALIGERGREVRDFIDDDLGTAGLARSILVVATSDEPPLIRREAAYVAMAIAEYFRDQGKRVMLIVDSITRLCIALREIAIAIGELPATRGYPPSVFTELPKLLERAGPGGVIANENSASGIGTITAFFTVLVEGDDLNEPIADSIRGILDGHITLDRKLAEAGYFPPLDFLRSLSRTFFECHDPRIASMITKARKLLSIHTEMAELIRFSAFQAGKDEDADMAFLLSPKLRKFLEQKKDERSTLHETLDEFVTLMRGLYPTY